MFFNKTSGLARLPSKQGHKKLNLFIMKKIVLPVLLLLVTVTAANAQDVFRKNDLVFNAGIGFGSNLYSGTGYKTTVPPVSVSGEVGVVDNLINGNNGSIGVGGYLGYTAAKYTYPTFNYGWKYNSVIIGARGTFHYQFARNLDTYAGAMLGYNIVSAKTTGDWGTVTGTASGSEFSFTLFVGARYYFTEGFGVFGELGYGVATFNVGVAFRM